MAFEVIENEAQASAGEQAEAKRDEVLRLLGLAGQTIALVPELPKLPERAETSTRGFAVSIRSSTT